MYINIGFVYLEVVTCMYVESKLCTVLCRELLPEARVDSHGYSSLSVCLAAHLAAIALRLQH